MKISLVTYKDGPKVSDGEILLLNELRFRNNEVTEDPWDDSSVDWTKFDQIILRAAWNYHENMEEFKNWLSLIEQNNIPFWNPIKTVLWNTDKHYLGELRDKSVVIIPTVYIEKNQKIDIHEILSKLSSESIIIKPTYGASSFGVTKFLKTDVSSINNRITELQSHSAVMVQDFFPEISQGETSIIFFNKKYSHSALKTPVSTDFRSQPHYGGVDTVASPPENIINQAQNIVNLIDGPLLYARVDGIIQDGIFHLMELELAEPYLFFEHSPNAPKMFVDELDKLSIESNNNY